MENNEEGVITFSQIWEVIKKSFARAAIYVVVCVIVCAACLYTARSLTVSREYSGTILIKQSDSAAGSILERNKTTAVSYAIEKIMPSGGVNTVELLEKISGSLVISPVISADESSDTEVVATTFTASFGEPGVDGVRSSEYVALLQEICNRLVYFYSETVSADGLTTEAVWGYTADYTIEYLDLIDEIDSRLSVLENVITAAIDANGSRFGTFKSSATEAGRSSASEILAGLGNVRITLDQLSDKIRQRGIYNGDAAISGGAYCDYVTKTLETESEGLTSVRTSLESQIEQYAGILTGNVTGTVSGSGSGIIVQIPDGYTDLVNQLIEVDRELADVQKELTNVSMYKSSIESNISNDTAMSETEAVIDGVLADIVTAVNDYNTIVDEYNETYAYSTNAVVSRPAAVYESSALGLTMMLVVVVAVAVAAYAVAFGQTWGAIKKAGKLDEIAAVKPLPLAAGDD